MLWLLLSPVFFNPIAHGQDTLERGEWFEGEIHYSLSYDSLPPDLKSADLEAFRGSKIVLVFKDGNYKKSVFDPNGKLLSTRYLDLKQHRSFGLIEGIDTAFWFDIRKRDTQARYARMQDTLIGDYQCVAVYSSYGWAADGQMSARKISYCASELKIDPRWYEDYKEGDYNVMTQMSKGLVVESYEWNAYMRVHQHCDSVVWRSVAKEEIAVPSLKHRPLKEL